MMQAIRNNPRFIKMVIAFVVIIVSSFLLFFRLGHYALWDDEATTAMFAKTLWDTGDTYAMYGHNIIAYDSGVELQELHNRYMPPLQFYLAAPFVGFVPGSALAARLPFAICGLLTVILILVWLWRARVSVNTWFLMSAGILGNVSLMLYARQCRYFSPAILATTGLVYLYAFRDHRKRTLFVIVAVSLALLASNFMSYVAVYMCLVVDYLFWGRKTRPYRISELAVIFIPQLFFGGLFMSFYNLAGQKIATNFNTVLWFRSKINAFYWNIREINGCEYGVGILIVLAPLLYFVTKDKKMLRCPMAIFTYVVVTIFLAPKLFEGHNTAIVRYLAPIIPICILTSVLSIQALTARAKWLAIPLAILAFGTNVLHGGPLIGYDTKVNFSKMLPQWHFRSTIVDFVNELIDPPPSAYRATADWINLNLKDKETVWVMPSFATYPLMYHASKVIYAWQLKSKKEGQFKDLSDIHFFEQIPPKYVIAFGPNVDSVYPSFEILKVRGVQYNKIKQIDLYWYDLIRPELYWHSFKEIKEFSHDSQAIFIYKKINQP